MKRPIKTNLVGDTILIAHRGLSGIAPENTIPAFIKAGEYGFYGVECDFHVTKDGEFVVFHDFTLERMTNIKGNIKDYTYEELNQINIINGNNVNSFENVKIPLLSQYLDICLKYNMVPVIEVKGINDLSDLDRFVDLLKSKGLYKKAHVISFKLDLLVYLRIKYPDLIIYFLTEVVTDEIIAMCVRQKFNIDAKFTRLSSRIISKCHNAGILVNTYTVNNQRFAVRLSKFGIDFITSNILCPILENE